MAKLSVTFWSNLPGITQIVKFYVKCGQKSLKIEIISRIQGDILPNFWSNWHGITPNVVENCIER
jgi:hypothetical protein